MGDLEKFTDFLFGDNKGYIYVPSKLRDSTWITQYFSWPAEKQRAHDYIRTSALEGDVYISPVLLSQKSNKNPVPISHLSVVWVEFDGSRPINLKDLPAPNGIVQTSSHTHVHCYWKTEELNQASVEAINRRLMYYLEADSSGYDCAQVLRPPETFNYKYGKPLPVTLRKLEPSKLNAFPDFDTAPEVIKPVVEFSYDRILDTSAINLPEILGSKVFREIPSAPGMRSTFLMQTAHLLAENGNTFEEIISLIYAVDCRIKKFVGREDQLVRLSEIASLALFKLEEESAVESYSPQEILKNTKELNWLLPNWIHSRGFVFLSGLPGVGKTQMSLDLAHKLATGTIFLEKEVARACRVLYMSMEMEVEELKYIFDKQTQDFVEQEVWDSNMRIVTFDEMSLKRFERVIKEYKPDVVFVDSLSEISDEELKEKEAKRIMKWFRKMKKEYGFTFVVLHHNRKPGQDANNKRPSKLSDLYGSGIFAAKAETVLALWEPEGKDYLELIVVKARFDRSETIRVRRSEHLTFKKADEFILVEDAESGGNPLVEGNLLRFS
jgi:KaiC/GvpD/RAD55 family RecA-like ATPase